MCLCLFWELIFWQRHFGTDFSSPWHFGTLTCEPCGHSCKWSFQLTFLAFSSHGLFDTVKRLLEYSWDQKVHIPKCPRRWNVHAKIYLAKISGVEMSPSLKSQLFKKRVTWPVHWPISNELWSLHNISRATYLMTSHVSLALWTLITSLLRHIPSW